MAVVLKGEQQNDGSFVFKASSEQVDGLNKMCDGNLNTQLNDVQFGMVNLGVQALTHVKGTISMPLWKQEYDSAQNTFKFGKPTERVIVEIDGNYGSMTEIMNVISNQSFRDNATTQGNATWHFSQNINFNKNLAQQNIFSISLSYQCSSTTSETLTANVLNYDTEFSFTNNTEQTEQFIITGKSLIEALHLNDSNVLSQYPQNLVQVDENSITFTMKYQGSTLYSSAINIIFFSPINNSTQYSNYEDNHLRIPMQYSETEYVQQFHAIQPFYIYVTPDYFYFDCPQLTVQNFVAPNGKLYNIISKALNNTQSDQFFVMTTTEPLRALTLQSIADRVLVLRILNEDFIDYSRCFSDVQMIITAQKPQYNTYFKDSRKSLYTNVVNTHSQ